MGVDLGKIWGEEFEFDESFMIGSSTLGIGRQEIVNFQVYSIWGVNLGLFWHEEFEFDEIFKIQSIQMLRKKLLSTQNFSIYYGSLYLCNYFE